MSNIGQNQHCPRQQQQQPLLRPKAASEAVEAKMAAPKKTKREEVIGMPSRFHNQQRSSPAFFQRKEDEVLTDWQKIKKGK